MNVLGDQDFLVKILKAWSGRPNTRQLIPNPESTLLYIWRHFSSENDTIIIGPCDILLYSLYRGPQGLPALRPPHWYLALHD